MRLPWFSGLPPRRRRAARGRTAAAPLRVRRLERRRVLDAALSSLVVSPTVVVDSPEPAATESGQDPLVFDWSATDAGSSDGPNAADGSNQQSAGDAAPSANAGQDIELQAIDAGMMSVIASAAFSIETSLMTGRVATGVGSEPAEPGGAAGAPAGAPTLTNIVGDTIFEDQLARISFTIQDPDASDVFEVQVNWLDGESATISGLGSLSSAGTEGTTEFTWNAAARKLELRHQYLDDGPNPGGGVPQHTYSVQLVVSDGTLTSDPYSASVLVRNVQPVLNPAANQIVNEGQVLNLTGISGAPVLAQFFDNGTLDTHTATVDWDDGTVEPASVNELFLFVGGSHTYADQGTYTVKVTIADDDGGTHERQFSVTVKNVAPTLTLSGAANVDEGSLYTLNLSSADPGDDTITQWTIDWGNGIEVVAGNPASVTHTYADGDANYTISATATDEDGTFAAGNTVDVMVDNVAPEVVLDPVAMIQENGSATVKGRFTDPGLLDSHTVTVTWEDPNDAEISTFEVTAIATLSVGQTFDSTTDEAVLTITSIDAAMGKVGFSVQHQYLDDGIAPGNITNEDSSEIKVIVADEVGSHMASRSVLVKNVRPVLNPAANQMVDEGTELDMSGTGGAPALAQFIDDGTLDIHTATIDWGDGTVEAATVNEILSFLGGSHTYADDGTFTVIITLMDDDGGTDQRTFDVLVKNVAPVVALDPVTMIEENGSATVTGTYTDIGLLDRHTVTITWSDANDLETSMFDVDPTASLTMGDTFNSSTDEAVLTIASIDLTTGRVGFSVQHQYLDDGPAPGNGMIQDASKITVTVADDDLGSHFDSKDVLVKNVAPQLIDSIGTTIIENSVATISVTISDPGTLDVFSIIVNWQDGVTDQIDGLGLSNIPATTTGGTTYTWDATTRRLTLSHHYNDDDPTTGTPSDPFPVSLVVTDDDGQSGNTSITVIVQNHVPEILAVNVSTLVINEGQSLSINGTFTDRLIDFPTESFRAYVLWGDGNSEELTVSGPMGLQRALASITHTYVDNDADNIYTIRVRVTDDDMAAFATTELFLTGSALAGDFVELTVDVTVLNVNPTLQPISATDVAPTGQTTLNLTFSDPGADSFRVMVDWGERLDLPPDQRWVIETVSAGAVSPGSPVSFTLVHFYTGPPDPLNPTADIIIRVQILDDDALTAGVVANGFSNIQTVAISNPGIETTKVAIDTTALVPRLEFVAPPPPEMLLNQQTSSVQSLQSNEIRVVSGEASVTSERQLVLVVISPDGEESEPFLLKEDALADLRGLFATLPENRYRVYVVRKETNSWRLVIEVSVRRYFDRVLREWRGRIVDPNDASEGTSDRPPTSETSLPDNAVPLSENPLLERMSQKQSADATDDPQAHRGEAIRSETENRPQPAVTGPHFSRWSAPLAGLALVASGGNWSQRLDAALRQADQRAWQRLRRAGRVRPRGSMPAGNNGQPPRSQSRVQ